MLAAVMDGHREPRGNLGLDESIAGRYTRQIAMFTNRANITSMSMPTAGASVLAIV